MNGLVGVSSVTVGGVDPRIAELIETAEARLDNAAHALDPANALADATIALGEIALATFLRGGR